MRRQVRVTLIVLFLLVWVFHSTGETADFRCASGDVQCLIEAINTSNANGEANTIRLASGTYSLTEVNNNTAPSGPNGLPVIAGAVTIVGVAAEATTIERPFAGSAPFFRIFSVAAAGTLVVDGVTVRGGFPGSPLAGGALRSEGFVTITRSVFTENGAAACGAFELRGSASLILRDSRIVRNSVGIGGSILCAGFPSGSAASVVIDRTTISDNSLQEGSAISAQTVANVLISSSTIANNRTTFIGGSVFAAGPVTIVNSTITNNSTGLLGSAVRAQGAVQILNSTIANNRQEGVTGPATLRNTIVAGNIDPDNLPADCGLVSGGSSSITSLGHNLIGNPTNCGTLLASDLTGDPRLASFVDTGRPGGGVVRLLSDSRTIDAGDATACPAADQQGLARPIDGDGDGVRACDIGATEFYPVINDLVDIELDSMYLRPRRVLNPVTAGGEFHMTATLTNRDVRDLCSVAFEVVTLEGTSGAAPRLLTKRGEVIGGEGSIVPAPVLQAMPHLLAQQLHRYRFRVGLSQVDTITFAVNVLGEATAGPCPK